MECETDESDKKYKWIILGFFILFAIILGWLIKDLFLVQDGALYGNRLDGKEDIPITSEMKRMCLILLCLS